VLVIDELLTVIKNVSGAADTVKTIGTQGRGFGCFGLFLAQSWVGSEVGGTSARDNLTSLLVHHLKKKQANTLLQNSEMAQIASTLSKGELIFEPAQDEPFKLLAPFCRPQDAIAVYEMITDGNTIRISGSHEPPAPIGSRPIRVQADPELDSFFDSLNASQAPGDVETSKRISDTHTGPESTQGNHGDVVELDSRRHTQGQGYTVTEGQAPDSFSSPELVLNLLKANCETSEQTKTDWQKDFAARTGISESLLKLIMLGKRNITDDTIKKVLPHLTKSV
jgi:hypothetical protein